MPPRPPRTPADRKRAISLFAMWLIGVAIGCVLVGLILQLKHAYALKMEAAKRADQQQVSPHPAPSQSGAPVPAPGAPTP